MEPMETIPEEPNQTITKPTSKASEALKVKNPKRVAQGKRLAEISRAAKLRKKNLREAEETKEDQEPLLSFQTVIAIISTFTAVVSACIAYSQMSTESKEEVKTEKVNILDKYSL